MVRPGPIIISLKKDGCQRRSHRFHVSCLDPLLQTDTYENITFLQLRWRAVITKLVAGLYRDNIGRKDTGIPRVFNILRTNANNS